MDQSDEARDKRRAEYMGNVYTYTVSTRYDHTLQILGEVEQERINQEMKWGKQHHPNGTGELGDRERADEARRRCDMAAQAGKLTWRHISDEETAEAYAETDPLVLRKELIQQAAVLVAWVEDIDRRKP